MAGIVLDSSYAHVNAYTCPLFDEAPSLLSPRSFSITVRINLLSLHVMITASQASILSEITAEVMGLFTCPVYSIKDFWKIFPLKNKSCNKLPQTQWLKMIQIYDLTVV